MSQSWPATSLVALANLSEHPSEAAPLPPHLHLGQTEKNNDEWNRLGKLVLLSALAALGTLGNIFAISAVMTEDQLKKKGELTSRPKQTYNFGNAAFSMLHFLEI